MLPDSAELGRLGVAPGGAWAAALALWAVPCLCRGLIAKPTLNTSSGFCLSHKTKTLSGCLSVNENTYNIGLCKSEVAYYELSKSWGLLVLPLQTQRLEIIFHLENVETKTQTDLVKVTWPEAKAPCL